MRKLIVGSIVFVILFIVWTLYLDYDTERFIQGLPKPQGTGAQHQDGTPQTSAVTPKQRVDKTAAEALENADEPVLSETSEDFTRWIKTETDTIFDAEAPDIKPETDNSGLSPELETLFSEYYPLYKQRYEIAMQLNPLIYRDTSSNRQVVELFGALNGEDNEGIQKTLDDELDTTIAWKKRNGPRIRELSEARSQLDEQISNLLTPYGLTNSLEFWDLYSETFKTWQTQNGFSLTPP